MSGNDSAQAVTMLAAEVEAAARATARAAARPVHLVRIDLAFWDVFVLVFKAWLSLAILTAPVVVAFVLLGIL